MTFSVQTSADGNSANFQINGITRAVLDASGFSQGTPLSFRNKIINGDMRISQRGASFNNPVDGAYTLDRWPIYYDGTAGNFAVFQNFSTAFADAQPELFWDQTVAGTGGTRRQIYQKIEGVSTLAGQTVTLSFTALQANIPSLNILAVQYFGTGGSPSSTVSTAFPTLTMSGGSTRTRYSVTVTLPAISNKTKGTNKDDWLGIVFNLPVNATFQFSLTDVQLEAGSEQTPFEQRPIGLELSLCQRYYEKITYRVDTTTNGVANFGSQVLRFCADKRIAPTMSRSGEAVTTTTFNTFSGTSVSATSVIYNCTATAGYATGVAIADAEL